MTGFLLRVYSVPEEAVEIGTARIWTAGPLGVEIRPVDMAAELHAWFEAVPEPSGWLPAAPGESRGGLTLERERWVEAEDWQARYRRDAQPIEVGQRFLVDPGEIDRPGPVAGDRLVLRLPARNAFGTGSHESTRLAMELLERCDVAGRTVLDVGAGSGILSLAAERLGARRVVAVEIDLEAVITAGEMARLNRGQPGLVAGTVGVLAPGARFDLALVNVLPERIASEVPGIVGRVRPGGLIVVSGLLAEQRGEVARRWRPAVPVAGRDEGEWSALLLEVE